MKTIVLVPDDAGDQQEPESISIEDLLQLLAGQDKSEDQGALLRHAFDNMTMSLQKHEGNKMKMTKSELRECIRETVRRMREAVLPDENDDIDLANPDVLWTNTYDMGDQETSTKVANMRIRIDPDCADEIEELGDAPQLKMMSMSQAFEHVLHEADPKGWSKSIKKLKKDKNKKKAGSSKNPWSHASMLKNKCK